VATPAATATHKPIPHIAVVEKLIEALSFRQIGVVQEEYAVSADGMRMFGVMDLSSGFDGCRFAIGLRNSHDKSFRLSCTVGLRVFVCENLAFHGEYTPVLAKHSKNFSLEDSLAIGVDRMQRNFGPLKQQVEEWQALQLSAASAKLLIYQAFIEDDFDGFDPVLRAFEEAFYLAHELRLSVSADKAVAWLRGDKDTWGGKIGVIVEFAKKRGHPGPNIGRDYGLLSELAHPLEAQQTIPLLFVV
jgi:hypothetical protein